MSDKQDILEIIKQHLPKYLTPELKEDLFKKVNENFPLTINSDLIYFTLDDINYYYQGDIIRDIPFNRFLNGEYNTIYMDGIVISNTCDISPENKRLSPPNIQFAPIYKLQEYTSLLTEKNILSSKISDFTTNLKQNKISNLFYLPKKELLEESFVRFDQCITLPFAIFETDKYDKQYIPSGDRISSFSNYGFYMFLIKLSIHYCRFREGVFRNK